MTAPRKIAVCDERLGTFGDDPALQLTTGERRPGMTVTPPCDTQIVTTQLRLLSGGETASTTPRNRRRPAARRAAPSVSRLDVRTRQIGQSGVAEARRRLAEINATTQRAHDLVRAS